MSVAQPRVFNAIMSGSVSLSTGTDLTGGYLYVSLLIPSNTSAFSTMVGSPLWIKGSTDGVTYYRVYEIYTNAVATAFQIVSGVCAAMVPIPYFNYRYIQIESSGVVTSNTGINYKIVCTDSL